jgi:hypothetical protein
MRLNVGMTLNANSAQRFREAAKRLTDMDIGEDGLLAAAVLLRIADSYERAATSAFQSSSLDDASAENVQSPPL